MKILLFLLAAVVYVQGISFFNLYLEEWDLFKMEHRKNYPTKDVESVRNNIYIDNKHLVLNHNKKFIEGAVSFKLKLNKFADWLEHEVSERLNGYNKSINWNLRSQNKPVGAVFIPPAHVELPNHVDWRQEGAVTEVKDQGHCGSCWAFSTTGALEGQHFRKDGFLVSLSEQNLVDCSGKFGNNGCEGGLMDNAFQYIKENGGLDTEKSYPYEAKDDKCHYNPRNKGATDIGFVDVPQGDEEKLKAAVATIGPVSVAIDASHKTFQFYSEGVYYEEHCSDTGLDHGVLVVGYGTDETGGDYWLVKNSWGDSWGEQGYIKMARNRNNNCGIATQASYPLVK